jgi:fatty-acyl-CoA synthase
MTPQRVALSCAGADTTWLRLANRVDRAAARLAGEWGVGAGDRVAYLGANSAEELILLFALARLGGVLVPLNTRLAVAEWRAILANCAARLLVTDAASATIGQVVCANTSVVLQAAEQLVANRSAHEAPDVSWPGSTPVLLVYTSGSTGAPRGVLHTQDGLLWNASASIAAHDLSAADHVLSVLPLFHVGGLCIQTVPALVAGARVTLHGRFEARAWLAAVASARPSLSLLVPATLKAVIEHPAWQDTDLSSLRLLMTGSSIVPRGLLQAFHRRGIPVGQVYGSTETGPVSVVLRAERAIEKEGMAGWPALHSELRLTDAAGAPVPQGAVGEIRVRGRNLMSGYFGEVPGASLAGGWFSSGDLGRLDADGCLEVVGRSRDLIISGGENIYPAEIENLLLEHEAIAEVAVVAMPDERWGETPVAAVVLRPGALADAGEILARLDGRLAAFKRPRRLCFVASLPKSALGKVLRADLARQLGQGQSHAQ